MFQSSTVERSGSLTCLAGLSANLSSALAYASDLEDASISVIDDCGVIVLEGEAPSRCLARISEIAASFAGSRFCNLIKAT